MERTGKAKQNIVLVQGYSAFGIGIVRRSQEAVLLLCLSFSLRGRKAVRQHATAHHDEAAYFIFHSTPVISHITVIALSPRDERKSHTARRKWDCGDAQIHHYVDMAAHALKGRNLPNRRSETCGIHPDDLICLKGGTAGKGGTLATTGTNGICLYDVLPFRQSGVCTAKRRAATCDYENTALQAINARPYKKAARLLIQKFIIQKNNKPNARPAETAEGY